jgi:hypothetical protein
LTVLGSATLDQILSSIAAAFSLAAAGSLSLAAEPIPLSDVEAAWNRVEKGRRIVFTVWAKPNFSFQHR